MNLEEIRYAIGAAEMKIYEVLRVFKETTGMSIVGCEVDSYTFHPVGAKEEIITTGVRLKVEQI